MRPSGTSLYKSSPGSVRLQKKAFVKLAVHFETSPKEMSKEHGEGEGEGQELEGVASQAVHVKISRYATHSKINSAWLIKVSSVLLRVVLVEA